MTEASTTALSIAFTLDGAPALVVAEPKSPALEALRDLGVLGVKGGCSPQGLCGCCTVLVDGKARLTCTLPVKSLAGKSVTTLAGVDDATKLALARAFSAEHAAQCGYCTPGILLSASTLMGGPTPTIDDLHRILAPHTCRCTGYTAIHAAIRKAVAGESGDIGGAPPDPSLPLGLSPFVDDLVAPGALHGAAVFSPVGWGVVESVDWAVAAAMPGVAAVDVLRGSGATLRHAGEIVAIVAAESAMQAAAAAAAMAVTVREEPPAAAAAVARAVRRHGALEAAFAGAAHRVSIEIAFATTDAVPLEPETAIAHPEGAGFTVYSSGHDAGALSHALTEQLGAPVRVVLLPSGGSYGARAVATVEPLAARLAQKTGRTVRFALSHEEGTRMRARRPAARVSADLAATQAGEVLGLRLHVDFFGGAVVHEAERLVAHATHALAYDFPAAEVVATAHTSPGTPTGPIRGAGSLPVAVAVEALLDALCREAGLDRLELRQRYAPEEGRKLLDALAPEWKSIREEAGGPVRLGLTLATAAGGGAAEVVLDVVGPSEVEVRSNVPELGQGRDRDLLRALTRETGLNPEVFAIEWADSDRVKRSSEGCVADAAAAAGRALRAAGGPLRGLVGRSFAGSTEVDPPGLAAHLVRLDDAGAIRAITVATLVGADQDPTAARGVAEGASAMGVGVALSEEVAETGGLPETRFRYLGTFKSRVSPSIAPAVLVPGHGARDVADACASGAAAAVIAAVTAFEGRPPAALPAKGSAAARGVGIRIRGSAPASS